MKTSKIEKKQVMEDLFFADLEIHAIRFAEWLSKKGYEKVFAQEQGYITYQGANSFLAEECTRYTIKDLYKQFMIDDLCL